MPTDITTTPQLGLFDLKVTSKELLEHLNRWLYLQKAVEEQAAIGEAIDDLLASEFPDPIPGKKRLCINDEMIIEYDVKEAKQQRKWKLVETPFTAATQEPPDQGNSQTAHQAQPS